MALMWSAATTDAFDEWFAALNEDLKVAIAAKVRVLRTIGPTLGRPLVDTLTGSRHPNLKELRVDERNQVVRIAFAFDPERSAILLVGGDKQGMSQRLFYKQLIARADTLYDEHLARLHRRRTAATKRKK